MRVLMALCLAGLWFVASTGQAAAQAADFSAGLSAYNRGDYLTAMGIWRPLADRGDAKSQAGLAYLFQRGLGTDVDMTIARGWYEKAAAQGQAEAQLMLGVMYFYGNGVRQSYIWAFAWCEMAVISGSPDAAPCRDAAMESLTDSAQMYESYRLAQDLLKAQQDRRSLSAR